MKPSFRGRGIFISMNKYRGKSMKKKTKTITIGIIISVFLIGIVSAGLIDYFGRITGEVTVEGPVFYATSNDVSGTNFKELWINDIDETSTWTTISETESQTFITETFDNVIDFYPPRLELSVEAKLIGETTPPKILELEFGYFEENPNGIIYTIGNCRQEVEISNVNDYEIKSFLCEDTENIENIKGFYYTIRGRGTGDVQIDVKTQGNTKVKILGVAQ